jgi:hypothetical protein
MDRRPGPGFQPRRCVDCNKAKAVEMAREYRIQDPEGKRAAEARWRLKNPDKVKAKNWIRRSIRFDVDAEEVLFSAVVDRDNAICQLCQRPVSMGYRWPHQMSPELDHKVPVSRGGPHTYENVQLAHRICNLRKGAKIV